MWDQRYSEQPYAYGTAPNAFVKASLDTQKPGKILFAAEGEGRNAVYAAQQGWEVEAFDLSAAGRDKALALAKQNGCERRTCALLSKGYSTSLRTYNPSKFGKKKWYSMKADFTKARHGSFAPKVLNKASQFYYTYFCAWLSRVSIFHVG